MTAQPGTLPPDRTASGVGKLVVPSVIAALVALTLVIYGRLHHPTGIAVNIAGFSSPGYVKSWLATAATFFALIQVGSALVMYGKVPRVAAPSWIGGLHRWSGRLAVLLALPVAISFLYALGFHDYSTPGLLPSVLGRSVFRPVSRKMLIPPQRRPPRLA